MKTFVCWLIRRRLDAYRGGELGPSTRERARAHLARCVACRAELDAIDRLRAALSVEPPDLPEPVWEAFWPQVRGRLAAPPAPAPWRVRAPALAHPRWVFGSAVAAVAVAVVALVAPWDRPMGPTVALEPPEIGAGPTPLALFPLAFPGERAGQVVVQAVETADPNSSVMVFTRREPDVTVVWVFGLERT